MPNLSQAALVILGLAACGLLAYAVSVEPSHNHSSVTSFFSSSDQPKNADDIRLRDLETAAGTRHFIWGVTVPAGKALVIHAYGGDSKQKNNLPSNLTFRFCGPLSASFENRIVLTMSSASVAGNTAHVNDYSLEVHTTSNGRTCNIAQVVAPLEAGWSSGWAGIGDEFIGADHRRIYNESAGPEGNDQQIKVIVDAWEEPAQAGDTVGEVTERSPDASYHTASAPGTGK